MIIYSPAYLKHHLEGHPENKYRLEAIIKLLRKEKLEFVEPVKASEEDILRVHSLQHYLNIKKLSEQERDVDADTYLNKNSFEVALLAAGGAIKALDYKRSFALVRPPGHHATIDKAMGFCLFNNVAVASAYAIEKKTAKRVFILDIDVHHGNGTEQIFYSRNDILYLSLHQHPLFPGTGYIADTGEGIGEGYNINIPMPPDTDDSSYLYAFEEIVVPVMKQFKPELVVVSAGYDGHALDPLANFILTEQTYFKIAKFLKEYGVRVTFVLEGGYNPDALAYSVYSTLSPLFNLDFNEIEIENKPSNEIQNIVEKVKNQLSTWWDF